MGTTFQGPRVTRRVGEVTGTKSALIQRAAGQPHAVKIWVDLDNTPHVPFFKPIVEELRRRGYDVVLTARDAFQVCELAARLGVECKKIGRHYGKNRILKVCGLAWRTLQLMPFVLREKPTIGLSHGARSQILLCNLLRIPSVMIMDYEHARTPLALTPRWEIVPDVLLQEELQCKERTRIRSYSGIKEDVYAPGFRPDPALPTQLGLRENEITVTVRPPANEAHYHNPESESFFVAFMNRLSSTPGARAVLLPRNKNQEAQVRSRWPECFENSKFLIPKGAVDGLNLLWYSDLVVSGGGTMNREAAALGVPVYSIFRGKIGAVDRQLQREGRLTLVERIEDVEKILLKARNRSSLPNPAPRAALEDILRNIEEILTTEGAMPSFKAEPAAV